jgi:siroheme synthase
MEGGLDGATPCVVVSRASRSDEQVIETTVGQLAGLPKLPAPALLLIGVRAVSGVVPTNKRESLSAAAGDVHEAHDTNR